MTARGRADDLKGRRVLVVEDEYFLADDMVRGLKACGAEVVGPAATLRKAVALAGSGVFDVAVIDLNLRGEAGFPVADVLIDRGLPFVFTTGYDPALVPERFTHVTRWEKPFSVEAVLDDLSDLLSRGEPRDRTRAI